jgi:hypothetical protein
MLRHVAERKAEQICRNVSLISLPNLLESITIPRFCVLREIYDIILNMTELIRVVASGISIGTLAAQIAASITKLKSYWDQIQEAPEDIASLVEEIEDLYLLLADIEDDQRRNPISRLLLDGTTASRCLDHCKRGADRLNELAEELASDIQNSSRLKQKWASAKVVLKNDKLEKYRSKLERTIRLLSLSHQCYTR